MTQLVPAPEGIVYNASKLNITSLTIPVLLEWQSPKHRRKAPRFFISGGVVGVVKTISSSKIVYHDADGEKRKKKMDRGMNLRPVTIIRKTKNSSFKNEKSKKEVDVTITVSNKDIV